MKEYIPKFTKKEVKDNHRYFKERLSIYKKEGLDFEANRVVILEKSLPLKGKILEIGTGRGHMSITLAKEGYRFVSVDKDEEALKIASLNLAYKNLLSQVAFYIMDANFLLFKDNSFNNIVCVDMFHHISNIEKIISEMDRVLNINGKLILADFDEKGRKIVNSAHEQEGRIHPYSTVDRNVVNSYLENSEYEIKNYNDKCHWLLVARKR